MQNECCRQFLALGRYVERATEELYLNGAGVARDCERGAEAAILLWTKPTETTWFSGGALVNGVVSTLNCSGSSPLREITVTSRSSVPVLETMSSAVAPPPTPTVPKSRVSELTEIAALGVEPERLTILFPIQPWCYEGSLDYSVIGKLLLFLRIVRTSWASSNVSPFFRNLCRIIRREPTC